jgi:HSP90 family molecular chaperone
VLLLPNPVDSFSVTVADYEGKPFKLVTQGAADLALIPLVDTKAQTETAALDAVKSFVDTVKTVLSNQVSDVCLRGARTQRPRGRAVTLRVPSAPSIRSHLRV